MESNTILLPQIIIDTHVHGRDLDEWHKTTVEQVLFEAKRGLISVSNFMPNTRPANDNQKTQLDYLKISGLARKKLRLPEQYFWFGLTDTNLFTEGKRVLNFTNIIGLKAYPGAEDGKRVTTGTIGVSDERVITKAISFAAIRDKASAFHCSDPKIVAIDGYDSILAESEYVKKIITLAKKVPKAKIVICHVSCRKSAELIIKARKEGLNIAIELAPHYLWFDKDRTNWNPNLDEVFYKCFNNLRGGEDREFLQSLLASDEFVIIGSDSACHTTAEKLEKKLGGIPSNQEMVAVIVTLAKKLKLSDERVLNLLSFNASRFLNIPVPRKVVEYQLEERIDDLTYNNGIVTNPWNGSKLLFPKKI